MAGFRAIVSGTTPSWWVDHLHFRPTAMEISNVILFATAFVYWRTVTASTRASRAATLLEVLREMQSDRMRESRGLLYDLRRTEISAWTTEQRNDVEYVIQFYSSVAMLYEARYLPRRVLAKQFAITFARVATCARPLIEQRERDEHVSAWPNLQPVDKKMRAKRGSTFVQSDFDKWWDGSITNRLNQHPASAEPPHEVRVNARWVLVWSRRH